MALGYLLNPNFQTINTAGKPATGGWLEVYIHGSRTKYYCASDWDGTLHPFKVELDSLGSNIVLADDGNAYDVYFYNRYGGLMMSRSNVTVGRSGGGGGGETYVAGDGITIEGTTISIDDSVVATKSDIPEVPVKDVTVDGTSVVNEQGVAEITMPTIPVTDVEVDGTSVVNASGVAEITMPTIPVTDVEVDGTSVVNSQGVAEITMPTIPVTDVEVDGASVVNAQGVAEITMPTFTQVQSDWTEADSASDSFIKHKPTETTLVAGTNITLTEGTGTLTISAAGGNVPTPGSSDAGKLLTVTDANGNFAWQDSAAPVIRFKEGSSTVTYSELDQFTLGDYRSEIYGRRKGDTTVTMFGLYGPYPTSSDATGKFLKVVYGAGNKSYAEWANPEPLCDLKLLEPQIVNLTTTGNTTLSIQDEYGYDVRITGNVSPTLRLATQSEDTLHTVIKVKMSDISYCGTFTMEWYDEMLNQHGLELDLNESTQSFFFDVYVRRVYYSNAWYTIARVHDFPCAYRESPFNSTSRTNNTNWIGRWL